MLFILCFCACIEQQPCYRRSKANWSKKQNATATQHSGERPFF